MQPLSRDDLYSLEVYAEERPAFRSRVLAHKRERQVTIGAHITLNFEDRLTIQYQIQEMLRVERIFEAAGIEEELAAYNPLIPDGSNLKATMMIEYADAAERQAALIRLRGVEERVWLEVAGGQPVWAIADEDLDRSNETKTSAVHFLRFELTADHVNSLRANAKLAFGVTHPAYEERNDPVADAVRAALIIDLD